MKREFGLDLLRSVAMLMVVAMHFPMLTGFFASDVHGFNHVFSGAVKAFAGSGLNCFWLLSGYLLATKTEFRAGRFFGLLGWTFLYSWLSLGCLVLAGEPVAGAGILRYVFPVPGGGYWFVEVYLALLLLVPALNAAIGALSRKATVFTLGAVSLLESVLPTVGVETFNPGSFGLGWAMALYAVGAAVRVHALPRVFDHGGFVLTSAGVLFAAAFGMAAVAKLLWGVAPYDCTDYNFPLTAVLSFAVFNFFRSIEIGSDSIPARLATFCGPSVFAVYLIHVSPAARKLVWPYLAGDFTSPLYPVRYVLSVFAVFAVCTMIDKGVRWIRGGVWK